MGSRFLITAATSYHHYHQLSLAMRW